MYFILVCIEWQEVWERNRGTEMHWLCKYFQRRDTSNKELLKSVEPFLHFGQQHTVYQQSAACINFLFEEENRAAVTQHTHWLPLIYLTLTRTEGTPNPHGVCVNVKQTDRYSSPSGFWLGGSQIHPPIMPEGTWKHNLLSSSYRYFHWFPIFVFDRK